MGTNYVAHGATAEADPARRDEIRAALRGERLTMGSDVTPGHQPVGAF
jgi:hypothetical protein